LLGVTELTTGKKGQNQHDALRQKTTRQSVQAILHESLSIKSTHDVTHKVAHRRNS
jgi:hypothetical protein